MNSSYHVTDIFLSQVEIARGDTHNLVLFAIQEKQLARGRLQDCVDAMNRLRLFEPELESQVALYVRSMEHLVQGSINWTFMTHRE